MIPWLTLIVYSLSLLVTLFLLWALAAPKQDEPEPSSNAVGFRYPPPEEP